MQIHETDVHKVFYFSQFERSRLPIATISQSQLPHVICKRARNDDDGEELSRDMDDPPLETNFQKVITKRHPYNLQKASCVEKSYLTT